MPQNNPIVAALPASGAADKELLREWAVQRTAFCLRPDEDLRDFNMIDPDGGGTTPAAIQNGLIYSHDEDDTTTAHDGVTCLVSADGQRYKIEAALRTPFNVLDKDLTAPPGSPSYGDAYLIYGSPTGAWAGKAGYIAIYTARGWSFALPPIGFLVYVRDETSFYHRHNSGAWTLGTGTRTLGANSVSASNIIGQLVRWRVENQITNAPPASPSVGDQYIIGPSPTGAWAGQAAKLAICESGSSFTIYNPGAGWLAYDKATKGEYRFDGSAWVAANGAWAKFATTGLISAPTATNVSATAYATSTTPPTTSNSHSLDATTQLPYTARAAGVKLRLRYTATLLQTNGSSQSPAFFVDNNSTAIHWSGYVGLNGYFQIVFEYVFDAPDALPHTYKFRVMIPSGGSNVTFARAQMTMEEAA